MPLRNQVDPWGDLHADPSRGLFTGNRGCLVDDEGEFVRHHRGNLWITCILEFNDWQHPLTRPGRWTPIFFLDDAVALAAGHRPCGLCRREDYNSFQDSLCRLSGTRLSAVELNLRLATERLPRGGGLERSQHRRTWSTDISNLPDGAMIVDPAKKARMVLDDRLLAFSFRGWIDPLPRPPKGQVSVLTPPTSVRALQGGFQPVLHHTSN